MPPAKSRSLATAFHPLYFRKSSAAKSSHTLAVGLEDQCLAGAGAITGYGHVVSALDVLVGLDLHVVAVDGFDLVLAVADLDAVFSGDDAGVHVDAGDLAAHDHHVDTVGNSSADGGIDPVTLGISRRIVVEKSHIDGIAQIHADLDRSDAVFTDSDVTGGVARCAVRPGAPLHHRIVVAVARSDHRNDDHHDRKRGCPFPLLAHLSSSAAPAWPRRRMIRYQPDRIFPGSARSTR